MLFEWLDLLAAGRIPKVDHVVIAGGRENSAVQRECEGVTTVPVGSNGLSCRPIPKTRARVPNLNLTGLAWVPCAGCEILPVRRKGHRSNRFSNPGQLPNLPALSGVKKQDRAIAAACDQ